MRIFRTYYASFTHKMAIECTKQFHFGAAQKMHMQQSFAGGKKLLVCKPLFLR